MNIVFTTQTVGLEVFYSLLGRIRGPLGVEKVGFYVAHSMYYNQFLKEHPEFEQNYPLVKEWEIVKRAKKTNPDLRKISEYEKTIGNPTLWEPLICDRRVYLGRHCKERQDYRPAFRHERMLSLLQVGVEELSRLLDEVKGDVILSLDPVTFGDYLFYLIAREREIPILFFRTTKIRNYVSFEEVVFGCSPHIRAAFERYEKENIDDEWIDKARVYLEEARSDNIRYEGMIFIPSKRSGGRTSQRNLLCRLISALRSELEYRLHYRNDHHIPGIVVPALYKSFITPLKSRLHTLRYSTSYVALNKLDSRNFAFYPLQSEPEIASLIWGKPYVNQIEFIRNIARSLPVGMKLLVKEHPRALGYRSFGYYGKILEIPNVVLIGPDQEVRPIIKKSKLVVTMAGFVGFEAVINRKPSIMLGGPRPFTILPDSMISYVNSMNDLAAEISDLLKNYEYREESLVHYIAATMRGSVPVDYFTTLLRKRGRHGDSGDGKFEQEIEKMAEYTVRRVREVLEKSN